MVLGDGLDDGGSTPGRVSEFFSSRPVLEPTQPISQWVRGSLSLGGGGVKRPGREDAHSPPPSAEVKNAWSYTPTPPIRLNDVVLI
jgi:hypothetical protein